MIGLIRTTTHNRIVAAKDAEIAGLMKRLDAMSEKCAQQAIAEANARTLALVRAKAINDLSSKLRMADYRYDKLEAQLAVFTGPRKRDAAGRFVAAQVAA